MFAVLLLYLWPISIVSCPGSSIPELGQWMDEWVTDNMTKRQHEKRTKLQKDKKTTWQRDTMRKRKKQKDTGTKKGSKCQKNTKIQKEKVKRSKWQKDNMRKRQNNKNMKRQKDKITKRQKDKKNKRTKIQKDKKSKWQKDKNYNRQRPKREFFIVYCQGSFAFLRCLVLVFLWRNLTLHKTQLKCWPETFSHGEAASTWCQCSNLLKLRRAAHNWHQMVFTMMQFCQNYRNKEITLTKSFKGVFKTGWDWDNPCCSVFTQLSIFGLFTILWPAATPSTGAQV